MAPPAEPTTPELDDDLAIVHEALLAHAREVERAWKHADAANAAKSRFLAHMSHEMRTPMHGIVCVLHELLLTGLDHDQREAVDTALSSADSLLQLINEVLDHAKIEAGEQQAAHAPFRLRALLDQVVRPLEPPARNKGLRLTLEVHPDVPVRVVSDAARIRQVLTNLMGNAIKFTDRGEVSLTVELDGPPGEHARLLFTVADTGVGIPPERLEDIFDPFQQALEGSTRAHGGTGLGLTITASLTRLLGGRIEVDSVVGEGSIFVVSVELEVAAAETSPEPSAAPTVAPVRGSAPRVLLAEDHLMNQKVASRLLRRLGCEVDVASDGAEAIRMVEERSYALVLMDLHMPDVDGIEATRAIRAEPRNAGLAIVALTAAAMAEDRQRCIDAGMDDFLAKPFEVPELRRVIDTWCAK